MKKRKIIFVCIGVAALGAAALYLYRRYRRGREAAKFMDSDQAFVAASDGGAFPVFPVVLVSDVQGVALVTKNPGNLRVSGDAWQGKIGEYQGFESFSDWAYGVRALLKTLVTYYNKHGLRTIRAIVSRYAPPAENNTEAYINNVALWTGIGADKQLQFVDLLTLAPQLIRMETGIRDVNMPYLKDYVNRVNSHFKVI